MPHRAKCCDNDMHPLAQARCARHCGPHCQSWRWRAATLIAAAPTATAAPQTTPAPTVLIVVTPLPSLAYRLRRDRCFTPPAQLLPCGEGQLMHRCTCLAYMPCEHDWHACAQQNVSSAFAVPVILKAVVATAQDHVEQVQTTCCVSRCDLRAPRPIAPMLSNFTRCPHSGKTRMQQCGGQCGGATIVHRHLVSTV